MRRVAAGACMTAVLALQAGCGPAGDFDPAGAGLVAPEVLAKASLRYYWQRRVRLDAGEAIERIWRLDENVYALTNRNRLIALNAASGTFKWFYDVAAPGKKVFAPCHADDIRLPEAHGGISLVLDPPDPEKLPGVNGVVIHTLSYALLIHRQSGKLLRKWEFTFPANTPGTSDGRHLFVGSTKGWYYALRLMDGLALWTMGTGDMISTRPVVYRRRVYVASRDHKFYAIDPYRPRDRHLWTRRTDGPLTASFGVDSRGCFVPSEDFNLYAYDGVDGTRLWVFQAQGPLRAPVQLGRRTVYQRAERDRFYAIDLARGEKRWELADGRVVIAAIGPHACVLTFDRRMLMTHDALGRVEMTVPMTGLDLFVPNAAVPIVYAATRHGEFVCIRPVDAEPRHLTEKMLKAAPFE